MASIKIKFRPSAVAGRQGIIYYQIIHERKSVQLLSDYQIFPHEWDVRRCAVIADNANGREALIQSIRKNIRQDVDRLTEIIHRLEENGLSFTIDDVVNEYKRFIRDYTFFKYIGRNIVKLKNNGKIRTAETYTAALNSFRTFRKGEDILLDNINSELMEEYQAWLRQKGLTQNTVSFYNRILRAVYNRAVEEDIIRNRNPFRHVYTGIDKTVKRALPLPVIKQIKMLNLELSPALDHARDIFILSFMLRGMSFVDMAYLRKSDLSDGYVTYRRRKTGQQLRIEWTEEMQLILSKYPENKSDYLLPIIRKKGVNDRCVYRNASYCINYNLKKIARMVGISLPLTLYVARHSWASAAKFKGIPLSVISEGMGHENEKTTQIYLASLDTSVVDNANSLILSSIR